MLEEDQKFKEVPRSAATADVHAPSSNTAAIITYAAVSSRSHVITGIVWSYSGGTPANGNLKIEDGNGNIVFTMDITTEGAGFIPFNEPKKGTAGRLMKITLAAAGSGVSGKVSIMNHWTE